MHVNIETGSERVGTVAAVIIFFATLIYFNSWRGIFAGIGLASVGYVVVYLGCLFILKGFTKEQKARD